MVQADQRVLDGAHGFERWFPVLRRQIFHLALADAVLAGARPAHRQRPFHQAFEKRFDACDLIFIGRIHQQPDMKIAVADVADDRSKQIMLGDVALGFGHAFGKP